MKNKNEIERLQSIAKDSWYSKGVNTKMIEYSIEIFARHIKAGSILELGPAEGIGTKLLLKRFSDVTIVEGASCFCNQLKQKYPDINIINCLFEDYEPERKFNNIILGHVLEHVENPVALLKRIKSWLNDDGRILCAVPNSESIHRQAAVHMGLLKHTNELNEADIHHGHRRVYNIESLIDDFSKAGLKISKSGGYWLKPISNKQIEDSWNIEMLDAFMKLGEKYPYIAAEIYVVAN